MVIGILCESIDDFEVFSILVRRLIGDEVVVREFIPYPADGSINSKLEAASIKFFKGDFNDSEQVDFAIYFSDIDGSSDKKQELIRWVTKHNKENPHRPIITAFAEPHFEQWFISEYDCLISVLQDVPTVLPFSNCVPKEMLKRIILKYNPEMEVSSKEIRERLAENVNLNSLKIRESDFQVFSNELLTVIRNIQNC